MQTVGWNVALELSGPAYPRSDLYERLLSFMAQHAYAGRIGRRIQAGVPFETHARSRSAQGFTVTRTLSSLYGIRIQRGEAQIAEDGQDRYGLCMALSGSFEVTQFGRTQRVESGAYTLVSAAEPSGFGQDVCNETIMFLMPRGFVDERVLHCEQLCARVGTRDTALNSLMFESVRTFEDNAQGLSEREFERTARLMGELVLLTLNGSADLLSGERAIRAAHLARAKGVIRRRMGDPDLSLSDIARESGVCLRYLHDLFRTDGCTLWEYLKSARLQHARELLEQSSARQTKILDVSEECGFSNRSYFSTAFKRAFGVAPQEVLLRQRK